MVDKKTDASLELMKSLAEKHGFSLVPKSEKLKAVKEDWLKYNDWSSDKIDGEIQVLENKRQQLESVNKTLHTAVIDFMNRNGAPTPEMLVLFNQNTKKIDVGRVEVINEDYLAICSLLSYLKEYHKQTLESELKDKFMAGRPDFKGQINGIHMSDRKSVV